MVANPFELVVLRQSQERTLALMSAFVDVRIALRRQDLVLLEQLVFAFRSVLVYGFFAALGLLKRKYRRPVDR